jgi:hypothetical protein
VSRRSGIAAWRAHFGVWASVAGMAFVALLLAAPPVAGGAAIPAAGDPGASAVWLALAPPLARFPLGDGAAHVRLLSLAAAAVSIAFLLWRASDDRLVHREGQGGTPELVAAGFGVLAVVLSRAFFQAATTLGPTAVGALLALGLLALAEQSLRAPSQTRTGLGLALVAGAAAGGPLAAAAIGWPLAVVAAVRAWWRRARWLPAAAVAGGVATLIALALLARGPGGAPLGALAGRLVLLPLFPGAARLTPAVLASVAAELVDQIGVVALLVAANGLPRLRARALFFTLWPIAGGLALRAAAGAGAEGQAGMIVALAALALPIGAGTARLADRLGRAALPASAAIGVIAASWPLLAR